jgi:hypothetical protein
MSSELEWRPLNEDEKQQQSYFTAVLMDYAVVSLH